MCRRHVWECSVNSVQSLSRDWFIAAPWTTGRQTFLPITNLKSFLKLVYIESLMLHPLLSPYSPTFNLSQHQGLFKWVSYYHQVDKCWSFSFSISPSNEYWFHLRLILISLQSKGCSKVFSNTTVQRHQFLSAQLYLWSNSHIYTWLQEKPYLWINVFIYVFIYIMNRHIHKITFLTE